MQAAVVAPSDRHRLTEFRDDGLIKVEHEVEERADGVSANCGCDDMYHAWHHERMVQQVLANDGCAGAIKIDRSDIRRIVGNEEIAIDGRQHA